MRADKKIKGGKRTPKPTIDAPRAVSETKGKAKATTDDDNELRATVRALGGDDADYALVKQGSKDDVDLHEFSDHEANVSLTSV